jgi:AraC-like DNA-binding protein
VPYVELAPAPALRSLVACYWHMTGPSAEHRVLPDGCIDILLAGDDARPRVVGTMTRAIVVPAGDRGAIGIRFRAGEAARLLPEAPRELTDGDALLRDVWGRSASELEELLASCVSTFSELQAQRIDALLTRRIARTGGAVDLGVRNAVALLERGGSVRGAAEAASLSERQLARRFLARVGIAPKAFGRIMRLQRAAGAIAAGAPASTAAGMAGYADQAHFTRDARDLAGVTPRVLAAELRGHLAEVSDTFKTGEPAAA